MPSTLVFQGYQLHQILNDYQLPGFPVRWCKLKRKWKVEKRQIKYRFFKASIAIKFLSGIWVCYITYLAFRFPIDFQIVHKFVPIILVCFIVISILIDLIFLLYAEDLIGSCNWCNDTEIIQFYRQMYFHLSKRLRPEKIPGNIKLLKCSGTKIQNHAMKIVGNAGIITNPITYYFYISFLFFCRHSGTFSNTLLNNIFCIYFWSGYHRYSIRLGSHTHFYFRNQQHIKHFEQRFHGQIQI